VPVVQLIGAGGQREGRGCGVDYDGETPESMAVQADAVRGALHDRLTVKNCSPRAGWRRT
jgi:hypothetical protein